MLAIIEPTDEVEGSSVVSGLRVWVGIVSGVVGVVSSSGTVETSLRES